MLNLKIMCSTLNHLFDIVSIKYDDYCDSFWVCCIVNGFNVLHCFGETINYYGGPSYYFEQNCEGCPLKYIKTPFCSFSFAKLSLALNCRVKLGLAKWRVPVWNSPWTTCSFGNTYWELILYKKWLRHGYLARKTYWLVGRLVNHSYIVILIDYWVTFQWKYWFNTLPT